MLRILFFPPSGLLQSAVITLYTVYLTWSALLYDPGKYLTVTNAKVGLIQENAVGTRGPKTCEVLRQKSESHTAC